ncbi:MAG: hypothetical protein MUC62_02980 [Candidatus Thermoplasmatota archaeon]|nr:hypothetical protein [Candidatus Thermoplasmatota archaeon]
MKPKSQLIVLFFLFTILITSGCINKEDINTEDDVKYLSPEVRYSERNYDNQSIQEFWCPPIWKNFSMNYMGYFSTDLKEKIITDMKKQVTKLGLDENEFFQCFNATDNRADENISFPCLAERAKYYGFDVWIFIFVWGTESSDLAHDFYCVINCRDLHILKIQFYYDGKLLEDDIKYLSPEVRYSERNYDDQSIQEFWCPPIWENFSLCYNGQFIPNYKEKIINDMKKQVTKLGLDIYEFNLCFNATVISVNDNISLPCLAERAKYFDTEVWIFTFNYGLGPYDLSHIFYYVISCNDLKILKHEICD